MSYLSDDDDDYDNNNNNNNRSRVNVQDEIIENPTDKPSTYKKRDKIISSKINRFAKGFKIPNDKKRKKAKISRYK
jgi:Ni/Co efflux regulator RcnB